MADLFAASEGLDPTQVAPGTDLFADPNAPGPFKRGLKASVAGLKGSAAGALALIGDISGIDSLKQYGLEAAQRAGEAGAEVGMRVEDIGGVGDAIDFAKYGTGYLVPQLATALAAGTVGRFGGALAARGLRTPAAGLLAKNAGMTAGLAASSIAQEAGAIYPEAIDAGVPDAAARSVLGGVAAGSLDVLPELLAAKMLGLFGKRVANPAKGISDILLSGAKGAAIGAGIEGGTELAQTAIERTAAGQPVTGDEAFSDYINSVVLGAIGGGVVGGPVGAVSRIGERTAPPPVAAPVQTPATTPEETPPISPPPPVTPDAPSASPFSAFDAKDLRVTLDPDQLAIIGGPGTDPVVTALDRVQADMQATRDRIAALNAELKSTAKDARPKQEVAKDKIAAVKELEALTQREANTRALMDTPEYKEKGTLSRPLVIGEPVAAAEVKPILTLEQDEALRLAEKQTEEINAARQGGFRQVVQRERGEGTARGQTTGSGVGNRVQRETQGPAQAGRPSSVEAQLGLIKRSRGLLLSADEAKAVREYERAAPGVVVATGSARETAREVTPEARRDNFGNAYSRGVDKLVTQLATSGVFSQEKAARVRTSLKTAVEKALAQPDANTAGAHFNSEFEKALKGLPPVDIETFREALANEVRASLPKEISQPAGSLRSVKVEPRAGVPASAVQQTLFSKAATAPQYVEFMHWGDVPNGVTDPNRIGTGKRGADWQPAATVGLSYTSAVVRGTKFSEAGVTERQPYVGRIPADKVYAARADDPLFLKAVDKIRARYGANQELALMQYAKDVRDLGYDAMLYPEGQLRIFTPQSVEPYFGEFFTAAGLPTIPDGVVNERAKAVMAQHDKFGGSTTFVRSGQDGAGMQAYAVSVYKGRELVLPGRLNAATVAKYIRANDDLLADNTNALGTWFNPDDGNTYVDITKTVPDMRTALRLARDNQQLAIFDLRTLTNISLGHPLFDLAQVYNEQNGLPPIQEISYIDYPPGVGRQIADAYEQLQDVNPDPAVKDAFDALAAEEKQMFDVLSSVIKIEPWTGEGQPYKNSAEMRADVFGNNHLWVFQGGEAHPYRNAEETFRGRAVHDLFAHARTGFEFGPVGELNATRIHAQMYSAKALPALIIDNIGQNAWVNYSRANEGLPPEQRAYARQKVDFLPEALWKPLLSESEDARVSAVDRRDTVMERKGKEALAYLEKTLGTPSRLEVTLAESLERGAGVTRLGRAKDVMELALNSKDILSVAAHEGFHYLENRMFTDAERRILAEAFSRNTPTYNRLIDSIKRYDATNGTNLQSEVEASGAEARAYGFEFWRRGELEVTSPVRRLFEAIRQLLVRISNFVNGLGFTSYEDVFRAVERGHYARRELAGLRFGAVDQSYVEAIEPDAIPGSAVLHRNRDAASRAKGRPAWIKTPADLAKMRKLIRALTAEGDPAKDWYRRSGQAIMAWAGGDKGKAGKLAALVAMYSPRTPVGEDIKKALQHYAQWEAKRPIDAGGTRHQNEYGTKILNGTAFRDYLDRYSLPGNPDTAPKITSFFKNLMQTIDPDAYPMEMQDSTIDMWMSHIFGFGAKDGKLTDANYWWADAEIKKLARDLNLAPDQVQAAVWVAIKARGNMTRALARKQGIERGWFKATLAQGNERSDLMGRGGRPTVWKLKDKHEFDYMVNWIRLALAVPFSKANFDAANYSYAEALRDVADGTVPLNRLDFKFEIDSGLFNDIAFGKVSQGELTFYSRAATLADVAQRVREGELPRQQLNAMWAEAVDGVDAEGLRAAIQRPALAEAKGSLGSFKRFYSEYLSSGLNLARHSAGFKNVFGVLTAYTQRKNRLIANAVEKGLSEWTGPDAGTQVDKVAVSKALLTRTEHAWTAGSPEMLQLRHSLTAKQRSMFDQATTMIANQLDAELRADAIAYRALYASDEQFQDWYNERAAQVARLKNEGYFPERRYGDHIVHAYVAGADGKKLTVYYSQHEREADARTELAELQQLLPNEGLSFEYGYRYRADYDGSLSYAQFLDLASRHGVKLTQAEKERIGKALIAADSTRRNRIFRRKNIAGYSEDGLRVLAEFGVTMANKVAYAEIGKSMNDALSGREVDVRFTPTGELEINTHDNNVWQLDGEKAGFYRNVADQTVDFVMSPRQGTKLSRGLRLAATAQFLGGSAAAAVVQLTSLPMNTIPWLTQYTSYVDASAKMLDGARLAARHLSTIRNLPDLLNTNVEMEGIDSVSGLRRALQIAAQDGTVLDTEIYQIMGLSRGQEYSFSGRVQNAVRVWMYPFRISEQFNRVSTFIAAYKVAKERSLTDDAAYKSAQEAVYGTQFRYDEANRPALARGDIGSLLFVFKSYPIYATELMAYLAKENPRSAVYMLLSFAFMSGLEGLPFAEDVEDLVDTIAQRIFGSTFNSKRALRNVLKSASEAVLGTDLSSVFMHGVANELTGLSFASRVGLGNLIPATRIGTADVDYKRTMNEALGPIGSLITGVMGGLDSLTRGQYVEAAKQVLPLAGQNLIKGWEQWEKGFATDLGGRKLIDVDGYNAFWQAIGFSSSALAKAYDTDRIDKQTSAFYTQAKLDFTRELVKAVRDGDKEKAAAVVASIKAWNQANPSMPMALSPAGIRRQIQLGNVPLNERTFRSLPSAIRGQSEAALGLEE